MARIRVLVVDDAVVVRRLLSQALEADPDFDVVGVAASGRIALAKIGQLTPDVVTLDVEMPEMSGLETLRIIRRQWPQLPVVMFSSLTERGAAATLEALALGAADYVTKPAGAANVADAMQRVREELLPKLKALCGRGSGRPPMATPARAPFVPGAGAARPAAPARPPLRRIDLVAIGVSTGGPNALAALLPALPAGLPVPIVIVQHMPPVFTRLLAERLAARCGFPVREAVRGARLAPGEAWVAPGDHHLTMTRTRDRVELQTNQEPPENSCRPAVDPLFRSAVAAYGAGTLAVVLTGMGHDGLRGCELIRERGGQVLAQDQATSVVWGMPGAVAEAGLADRVLPLSELPAEILRRLRVGRTTAEEAFRTATGRP